MNIAAYCRVSTDKNDQLNSLETQKRFFEEYAEKYGYRLVHIYADEGITGTQLKKRHAFQQLMEDADSGLFEMVAVKDISRFARNAVDFLQGIRYLKHKGIACNFVNASLTSQDSEMILGTLALVAQEESANTSKRVKFSKRLNAEKGRVPNLVYGYDKTPGEFFQLAINEREAAVVRRIFRLYTEERQGQGRIAAILNAEGIVTKRGCRWTQTGIARILRNPIYIGRVVNGREEIQDFLTGTRVKREQKDWLVRENPSLQIVEQECFNAAEALMNAKGSSRSPGRRSEKHLFSTILRCQCCGRSFRRLTRTYKNTYVTWVCGGRNEQGTGACRNRTVISEPALIKEMNDYFLSLLEKRPGAWDEIKRAFEGGFTERRARVHSLQAKRRQLLKEREKYIELQLSELISMEELKEKLTASKAALLRLEGELAAASPPPPFPANSLKSAIQIERLTNAQLRQLIDRIEVDEEGRLDIYLQGGFHTGHDRNVQDFINCT